MTGGAYGIIVAKNSQAILTNVDLSQSSSGVLSLDSSNVDVTASNIHNVTSTAVVASRGSTINVSNTTINGASTGLLSTYNSVVNVNTAAPNGFPTSGVTISNTVVGAFAQFGGAVLLINATIDQNSLGAWIYPSASAFVSGTTFSNNSTGLRVRKNATVNFATGNVINNGFYGVQCHADSSYIVPYPPGTPPAAFNGVSFPVDGCVEE